MGFLLSFFSQGSFEDRLREMERNIRLHETKKRKFSLKSKRNPSFAATTLFGLCLVAVALAYMYIPDQYYVYRYYILGASLLISFILSLLLRKLLIYYYEHYSSSYEYTIEQMVLDQRELLEEFKSQKDYYYTHQLVSKFERSLRYFEKRFLKLESLEPLEEEYSTRFGGAVSAPVTPAALLQKKEVGVQTPKEFLRRPSVQTTNLKALPAASPTPPDVPLLALPAPSSASSSSPSDHHDHHDDLVEKSSSSSSPNAVDNFKSPSQQQLQQIVRSYKIREQELHTIIYNLQKQIVALQQQKQSEPLTPSKLYSPSVTQEYVQKKDDDDDDDELSEEVNHEVDSEGTSTADLSTAPSSWFNRVIDRIMGQSPENCIALICSQCHAHNGLQMMEDAKAGQRFICWSCKKHNIRLPRQGYSVPPTHVHDYSDDELSAEYAVHPTPRPTEATTCASSSTQAESSHEQEISNEGVEAAGTSVHTEHQAAEDEGNKCSHDASTETEENKSS